MVIALEYAAARTDVLRGAGDVCSANPDPYCHSSPRTPISIRTKSSLPGAEAQSRRRKKKNVMEGVSKAQLLPRRARISAKGEDMWQKLVSKHGNIAMVPCRSLPPTRAHATTTGEAGNTVHEVVVDYQRDVNGGNGWMRLLQIPAGWQERCTRLFTHIEPELHHVGSLLRHGV